MHNRITHPNNLYATWFLKRAIEFVNMHLIIFLVQLCFKLTKTNNMNSQKLLFFYEAKIPLAFLPSIGLAGQTGDQEYTINRNIINFIDKQETRSRLNRNNINLINRNNINFIDKQETRSPLWTGIILILKTNWRPGVQCDQEYYQFYR